MGSLLSYQSMETTGQREKRPESMGGNYRWASWSVDLHYEPGQKPELGVWKFGRISGGVLLDSLSLRSLHPLTVGCKSLILPRESQRKHKN